MIDRKREQNMKKNRKAKQIRGMMAATYLGMHMGVSVVHASGVSSVTQPLENLKTLVVAIIGAIGVIILAKNVMEFAQAYQQHSSSMNSALKGIVAGLMMAGISTVLSFLGF